MAKYIDREALVEWLKRIPLKDLSDGLGLCRVIFEDDFKKAIKEMPKSIIADVAPVRHGHWDEGHEMMTCTNCCEQFDLYFKNDFNYCPNCGAKMDEEVSE